MSAVANAKHNPNPLSFIAPAYLNGTTHFRPNQQGPNRANFKRLGIATDYGKSILQTSKNALSHA